MHTLISTQPAFSHAAQMIPLAQMLAHRGHTVTFATSAPFVPRLQALGFDAKPFAPEWEIRPGDGVYDRTVGRESFFGFAQVPTAATVAELTQLAQQTGAQLIVREYSEFAAWAVARRLGLPLVTHSIIHRLPPEAEAHVLELAARVASLAGVNPPCDADELLGKAYINIVPPSFRCPWEHTIPAALIARPSLYDGPACEPAPSWLGEPGRALPLLYVTLGTVFNDSPALWRTLLDAVGRLDVDAVITTGPNVDAAGLGEPPPNARLERYVRQSHVLPRCNAVVCHAGFNTLIAAFRHGLPVVCLPLDADQPVNARCVEAAGAGISLANAPARDARGPTVDPNTLDPTALTRAIQRVLAEPGFGQVARRLAGEIEMMPGPEHTAKALEQLIGVTATTPRHSDLPLDARGDAARSGDDQSDDGTARQLAESR
jgi:UDP:flavonoid glycosyltransferase YjiC (YdhE family)